MKDEIYLISFKTEGFEQITEGGGNENGDDGEGGDDPEEDDLLDDEDNNGESKKKQSDHDKTGGKTKETGECSKSSSQKDFSTPKGSHNGRKLDLFCFLKSTHM